MKRVLPAFLVVLFTAGVLLPATDYYWKLGVGIYFGGFDSLTELDVARFDWLYLCYGNIPATRETTELLNRFLKINPRLKIVIRVWPIMGLGDCKENRYQATFLHYLYKPGVKEKIHERIRQQVRIVLDHIEKPENVIGLTFLEELPGHFSGYPFRRNDGLTWDLIRFKDEIEKERGKPLKWDDESRLWWARKWVHVINEIHATMKKESRGRLVFYYLQTNHSTLDMVKEGTPLSTPMLIPHRWSDVIEPGLCDGFFAYPNNEKIWREHYLRFALKNNWLFFSQLSHPAGMRLSSWEKCVELAKTRVPQNLGYFFYCEGDCSVGNAWNVDKSIPSDPRWNIRGISRKLHIRLHLAKQNVGMDIVRKQEPLKLYVDFPLAKARPQGFIHPRVIVQNAREASFFLDPKEAIVRNVSLSLRVPRNFSLPETNSPPATIKLPELASGERCVVDWWVKVGKDFDGKISEPFILTAKAEGARPLVLKIDKDTTIPSCEPHLIGISGTSWVEATYRLKKPEVRPRIEIECLRGTVHNPRISDGFNEVSYRGVLYPGQRVVLDPEFGARLFYTPYVDDDGSSRRDRDDPSGYKRFDRGYIVLGFSTRGRVEKDVPLKVTISGRAEDGGQSLVVLRFKTTTGTVDRSILVNRFTQEWRVVSQTVVPPPEAIALQNVYLYRFRSKGSVWYGPVKVERADASPEGVDVSERVEGVFPALSATSYRIYTYRDDNPPTSYPRARIQLRLPE